MLALLVLVTRACMLVTVQPQCNTIRLSAAFGDLKSILHLRTVFRTRVSICTSVRSLSYQLLTANSVRKAITLGESTIELTGSKLLIARVPIWDPRLRS